MSVRTVVVDGGYWKLVTYSMEHSGEIYSVVIANGTDVPVFLYLTPTEDSPKEEEAPKKYDSITATIKETEFEDPGYYREFLEIANEASEFITKAYTWCYENGFWWDSP